MWFYLQPAQGANVIRDLLLPIKLDMIEEVERHNGDRRVRLITASFEPSMPLDN